MTSDYGNFHLQSKFQMEFLSSQTQVLAHLAIRRSAALTRHMHQQLPFNLWIHATNPEVPCPAPFLLHSNHSTSMVFIVFSDFTWWRYYIVSCFSEIDGTKLEKNPCHMKCSSLFMRCDAKTWYSYVLFKITWYSYMIHINLTSILST